MMKLSGITFLQGTKRSLYKKQKKCIIFSNEEKVNKVSMKWWIPIEKEGE